MPGASRHRDKQSCVCRPRGSVRVPKEVVHQGRCQPLLVSLVGPSASDDERVVDREGAEHPDEVPCSLDRKVGTEDAPLREESGDPALADQAPSLDLVPQRPELGVRGGSTVQRSQEGTSTTVDARLGRGVEREL
jgi:hypothetical protein